MQYRKFGRLGWQVSEVGYGMWGLAQWKDTDKREVIFALETAVEKGCNFFDTAWAYGDGLSERILAGLLRKYKNKTLYHATKVPPKDRNWPSKKGISIDEVFPNDYIVEYVEKSLSNLKVDTIDLLQMHVWEDAWSQREEWKSCIQSLKEQGKIKAFGLSVNRWEPENCLHTIQTGMVDAIQVIYNVFDQNPEDKLFPLCREKEVAIIARVPFDEGSLTGKMNKQSSWPKGDWRNLYFCKENLIPTMERVEALSKIVPETMDLPEMALRFILSHPDVQTTIPGMRQVRHVKRNIRTSDGKGLTSELINKLRQHRWDRVPTSWSY